ncbi:DUF2442 domain-containing protein [Paraburkholderia bannensis]|uniref:hypothetical protein n=1 Tax=Paraburkholderia bannensis TaxID=765414 RepID=UPI000693BA9D|nr:hypothetical protein [Paraburkholderia bannensis]
MALFTREQYEAAGRAGERVPVAVAARYNRTNRKLEISYAHGVDIAVPIILIQEFHFMPTWPTPSQLARIEIWGAGSSIYFPRLGEAVWAPGLLNGAYGSKIWMEEVTLATAPLRAKARARIVREKGRQTGLLRQKSTTPLELELERRA